MTPQHVEADAAAGLGFVVLKTVIAEDNSGERTMAAWAIDETHMLVERITDDSGDTGWTVTWRGRGWDKPFFSYLRLLRAAVPIGVHNEMPVSASVKYHLPALESEPFQAAEYRHATQAIAAAWRDADGPGAPIIEKDFSPTLAGDARADARENVLRWLREVPRLVATAGAGPIDLGMKVMNARFDDDFQPAMLRALDASPHVRFRVAFNRLFDEQRGVAYGGPALSRRNLRALDADGEAGAGPPENLADGRHPVGTAHGRIRASGSAERSAAYVLPASSVGIPIGNSIADGGRTARARGTSRARADRVDPRSGRNGGARAARRRASLPRSERERRQATVTDRITVARVRLWEIALPLTRPFIISGGALHVRRSLIVELTSEDGAMGYGESAPFELPFYSSETLDSARALLTAVLLPRLVGRALHTPLDADRVLQDAVRGNPFARAGAETAVWDLFANRGDTPLREIIRGALADMGVPDHELIARDRIVCGVALGIPEDGALETLAHWTREALAQGYRRVKIKIRPGWDVAPIRAVQETIASVGRPVLLWADANASYDLIRDADALTAIDAERLLFLAALAAR